MIPVRSARAVALLDQLRAASTEASGNLHRMAAAIGGQVERDIKHPAADRIVRRLGERLAGGQVTMCGHLSLDAPCPTWWLAWAPGRIRCLSCAVAAGRRIRGTREDHRCDACRRVDRGGLHNGVTLLPGAVGEVGPLVGVWPPVTIVYGMCTRCQRVPASEGP